MRVKVGYYQFLPLHRLLVITKRSDLTDGFKRSLKKLFRTNPLHPFPII
jgi:hypothetical protein